MTHSNETLFFVAAWFKMVMGIHVSPFIVTLLSNLQTSRIRVKPTYALRKSCRPYKTVCITPLPWGINVGHHVWPTSSAALS